MEIVYEIEKVYLMFRMDFLEKLLYKVYNFLILEY